MKYFQTLKMATFGMDLTGRLWVLLSECSTYEELAVFMKIAFQQVRKCSVKPFVNTQNKSKLSDAMKILSSDPSANLQMLEPLELLIEIGIEKLKNDYIALFTQSGIAKEELLNIPNFISFTTMDNITWIETVSSYITWMSKIHSVAEVVHIAQFGLEVTPDVSTIIQRIFAYYLSPGSPVTSLQYLCKNPDLKFVTPIVNFRGQSNRNLKYEKWLMKLTTNEQHRSITTCFLRTLNFPFPDNMFSFSDKNNITVAMDNTVLGSSTDDKYFCSVMTSISNKIGVK
ncbi:uncharacterized protein LOC142329944 isoform X1 [Lycorma delicatula]|uniref:uncharacterized protein LOC142329944 isoform X1 n=2 Tax=Lycorma delicatula TaxID=130591 RepID=UPI003F51A1E7